MWKYNYISDSNELYHHGIKGQKWGVRRFQNKDGSRIKRTGEKRGTSTLNYNNQVSKKAVSFATGFARQFISTVIPGAGLALTAISVAKVSKENLDFRDYSKKEGPPEKLSDLKKKSGQSSIEEDARQVNPRIGKQSGTVNNCMNCTAAMEMRRRGYDVIARKSGHGVVGNSFETWFPGAKQQFISVEKNKNESQKDYVLRGYSTLCKELESFGPGARGAVGVSFKKTSSGHSMYWEITKNGVQFMDGQLGNGKTDDTFSMADPSQYDYTRLDNCKPGPEITTRIRSNPKN